MLRKSLSSKGPSQFSLVRDQINCETFPQKFERVSIKRVWGIIKQRKKADMSCKELWVQVQTQGTD